MAIRARNLIRYNLDTDTEDYRNYITCCSKLGRLADDDEYLAWAQAYERSFPDPEPENEPPFDDGPLFEPTQEDLAWLLSQREDVVALDHPETLAEHDATLASVARKLARGGMR